MAAYAINKDDATRNERVERYLTGSDNFEPSQEGGSVRR